MSGLPMNQPPLFDPLDDFEDVRPASVEEARGKPRFQRAQRDQVEFQLFSLDDLLAADHPARAVWAYVEKADLSSLYDRIKAVEGHKGRDPVDPRILVALWIYATVEGVGSARHLERLCDRDIAFRWICGGVSVNHHLLSNFRTRHVEWLDKALTISVATLMHAELVSLNRVSQDGIRVRASAGKSSFRRKPTLEEHMVAASARVKQLKEESEADFTASNKQLAAARLRAAEDREKRLRHAMDEVDKVAAQRNKRNKGDESVARASETDPEARVMKMPDGGYRPGYNVQFSTAGDSLVIVGVDVTNQGSDGGLMEPMVTQLENRYGKTPEEFLADGGFSTADDIDALTKRGVMVYTPMRDEKKQKEKGNDPYQPKAWDKPNVAAWRLRMGQEETKEIYRERSATIECVNAHVRNRNFWQMRVRGLMKVKAVALWHALTQNILCEIRLRARNELRIA
jgi:transposase